MRNSIDKTIAAAGRRLAKWKRSWARLQFDRSIHAVTLRNHDKIIADAEFALMYKETHESADAYAASSDQVAQQGYALLTEALSQFKDRYAGKCVHRILVHVPDPATSPAGYSLFSNLAECLDFMGVPTHVLGWRDSTAVLVNTFKPTVLLSSDHVTYLEKIDWETINKYRESNSLKVGLTASLAEYDNSPLDERLGWAKKQAIDFYYSFRDEAYVRERQEYRAFFQAGYKILYIPFGANILHYYPVAGFSRDLDYVLIASKKREHTIYMKELVKHHHGLIDGPGWKHAPDFNFNRDRDRYIYARAKIGLNVHLPEQIEWACEVNERTYQLAACGVPQVIDHPKLLDRLFSKNALFIADTPKQFVDIFDSIIQAPEIGQESALIAQRDVFERHTTFHRAESFMLQLEAMHLE